jgi:hypothetical protein
MQIRANRSVHVCSTFVEARGEFGELGIGVCVKLLPGHGETN